MACGCKDRAEKLARRLGYQLVNGEYVLNGAFGGVVRINRTELRAHHTRMAVLLVAGRLLTLGM